MWKAWLIGVVALSGLVAGRPAEAHPHIWIDVLATFMFDREKVTGVRFQWTFDEFFSAGVISEFDKNGNKKFDADEIEGVRTGAFDGVKEVGFFTDVLIDDKKLEIVDPTDFTASIDKGAAVYQFTVALPEPVDPARQALAVTVYDKSYFVDIAFQGGTEAIKIAGAGPSKCAIDLFDDRTNPIFGGALFPKKAQLRCAPAK